MKPRNYDSLHDLMPVEGSRLQRMEAVVDVLWNALHATGVSWLGFYLPEGRDELVLGPRRDKPACSPIGLHGACGQCLLTGKPLVIRDVKDLGPNYVACDPRDRSEIVLPLFDADRKCWGVFDADSWEAAAFDESDAAQLTALLESAGLSSPHH